MINLSAELKDDGKRGICLALVAVLLAGLLWGGLSYGDEKVSLWERMCEACHDGKTVLNGKVVIDRQRMKEKYRTIGDLVKGVSCEGAPCMNILKHDRNLVKEVGKEIGIPESLPK